MTNSGSLVLQDLRTAYHKQLQVTNTWCINAEGYPSNADKGSKTSIRIAREMLATAVTPGTPVAGQTKGGNFTLITQDFLQQAFSRLEHLRPGSWTYSVSQSATGIAAFNQYEHLAVLQDFLKSLERDDASGNAKDLRAAFASDYLITPDIVIARKPVDDAVINQNEAVVQPGDQIASLTPLRANNNVTPILHASVSCKWTLRSDRAQNARTEALNLIRNRKGNTPHIVIVTGEPLSSRLASLGLGTGDIDCVYHMALYELENAVRKSGNDTEEELFDTLVRGHRLRDISDLPFDLAI